MRRREPHHFYAFDALWLNGRDLRNLPLLKRKRLLRGVVPAPPSPLLYVDHIVETGTALYEAVCERDLEGIVAKLANGPYTADATTWLKVKNPTYSQAEGRHDFFNARAAGAE